MENSKKLIIMEIILICILLLTCLVLEIKKSEFKRDCKETFNLNDSCPCKQTKFNYSDVNLSNVNFTFNP